MLAFGALRLAAGAAAAAPPFQIFFPPLPPVLDSAAAVPPSPPSDSLAAPAGLAAYVGEPFYAPLATRLAREEVGDDLAFRLDTFRATREALRSELRAKLDTLRYTDPATRQSTLESFAIEQTPRILELENEAEQLREVLRWHPSSDREYLRWIVDANSSHAAASRPAEARLILGLAFYHDGLSPDQRRLLQEVAMEETQPGSGTLLYFSPATSRISLPPSLPPALSAEILAYRHAKRALENELIRALPKSDRQALASLAVAQAPQFAALEDRAESIRRHLAAVEDPATHPPLPPLSPKLEARIQSYREARVALQGALLAEVEAVKRTVSSSDPGLPDRIRAAIEAYTHANARRYAELDRERDELRTDIAALYRTAGAPGDAAADLTRNFSTALQELESYWEYREYRLAVLQPGLSPPQRRLLFGAAIESLALPLPGGETLPNAP